MDREEREWSQLLFLCLVPEQIFLGGRNTGLELGLLFLCHQNSFFYGLREGAREKPPVRLAFCSRVIRRRTFMDGEEGWTFVLVSPKHFSVNEEEEIRGIKRKK